MSREAVKSVDLPGGLSRHTFAVGDRRSRSPAAPFRRVSSASQPASLEYASGWSAVTAWLSPEMAIRDKRTSRD